MNRKGISPLIAAVLLIAFTMAVASLFAQWAPQLMQDAQADTSEQAEDISDHSDILLEISVNDAQDEVTIQQIAGDTPAGEMIVTLQDDGTVDQLDADDAIASEDLDFTDTRGFAVIDVDADTDLSNVDEVEADPSIDRQGAPSSTWTE